MEIIRAPKSLADISRMCEEPSRPQLNKAEDNNRPCADYFWLRLKKAAVYVNGGGLRAHLSAEP